MNWKAGRAKPAGAVKLAPQRARARIGFSVTEMVITISIIGVLAGIVLMKISGTLSASQEAIAHEKVEMLNSGLHKFNYANYEIHPGSLTVQSGTTGDEWAVLRTLQYRNPNEDRASLGSPYVRPDYNPTSSNSTDDFRIIWTGRLYKLLKPGETGLGIKVVFDGSDYTTPFVFPPNFSMAGR